MRRTASLAVTDPYAKIIDLFMVVWIIVLGVMLWYVNHQEVLPPCPRPPVVSSTTGRCNAISPLNSQP